MLLQRLAGIRDTSIKVWDTFSGREVLSLDGIESTYRLAFGKTGQKFYSQYRNGTEIWDATPWTRENKIKSKAMAFIRSSYDIDLTKDRVLQRIESTSALDKETKRLAKRIAKLYPVPSYDQIASRARRVATQPFYSRTAYENAARQCEFIADDASDDVSLILVRTLLDCRLKRNELARQRSIEIESRNPDMPKEYLWGIRLIHCLALVQMADYTIAKEQFSHALQIAEEIKTWERSEWTDYEWEDYLWGLEAELELHLAEETQGKLNSLKE